MKKHIAGIVPVHGVLSDFNMPWHTSLAPLAPNYLAVERAVVECAHAGCSTIWIVCSDDVNPLIRYQVGEKIQDPVYVYRHYERNKKDFERPIRIYYVPVSLRDLGKRDNLTWAMLHGARTAHTILKKISKWTAPHKFYVSWPYGVYDPTHVRQFRKHILESDVALNYNDQTIKNNLYLGLTLRMAQVELLLSDVRSLSSGLWQDAETRQNKLSPQERFSYRHMNFNKTLRALHLDDYEKIGVDQYHGIANWEEYRICLAEKNSCNNRPKLLKSCEWNEIGIDNV